MRHKIYSHVRSFFSSFCFFFLVRDTRAGKTQKLLLITKAWVILSEVIDLERVKKVLSMLTNVRSHSCNKGLCLAAKV